MDASAPPPTPPAPADVRVLHRDDDVAVVHKPGGMMVHRGQGAGRDEAVLLQSVSARLDRHVYPVHRLDRQTSGPVCFGLRREVVAGLQRALADDGAVKAYLVLVRQATPERFDCDRVLHDDAGRAKAARTEFVRLATFFRSSLLLARLRTGRRHQIRRHLAHLAFHVIGDRKYGKGRINDVWRDELGLRRMFLHACRLELDHPVTGARLRVVDPLPDDLASSLARVPDLPSDLLPRLTSPDGVPTVV